MKTKHTITAAVLALAAACAQAAPYAITYESAITGSSIPTVIDPQRFTLTLVMDNDGSSTANAEWVGADLTCAIWRMNDAANVVVAHDLTLAPPYSAVGRVTTDGGGTLTEVFSSVVSGSSVAPAAVRAIGLPPGDPLDNWAANSSNARVLFLASTRRFCRRIGPHTDDPRAMEQPRPLHRQLPGRRRACQRGRRHRLRAHVGACGACATQCLRRRAGPAHAAAQFLNS